MPFKSAKATMKVEPRGASKSEVFIVMEFTPKFGLLGGLMGSIMIRPIMRRMFRKVLGGLEHHTATGEQIGKGWKARVVPDPANEHLRA